MPKTIVSNNISLAYTFSNTNAEKNFHIASAKAELRGVEILRMMEDYAQLPDFADLHAVAKTARDLRRLATVVQDITDILHSTKESVDPYSFYWEVRPWFRGSDCGVPNGYTMASQIRTLWTLLDPQLARAPSCTR